MRLAVLSRPSPLTGGVATVSAATGLAFGALAAGGAMAAHSTAER